MQHLRQCLISVANSNTSVRVVLEKLMKSKANLEVVKAEIKLLLSVFKQELGRSSLVKQQEIYCYHKRNSGEIECMHNIL